MIGRMPVARRFGVLHRAFQKGDNTEGDRDGNEKALHGRKRSGARAEWRDGEGVRMLGVPSPRTRKPSEERSPVRFRCCPATVMPLRGTSQVASPDGCG